MSQKVHIFWFRRDLRLDDNAGLFKALQNNIPVLPIFIFDKNILDKLPKDDARVSFIFKTILALRKELEENYNSSLALFYGTPIEVFQKILNDKTYDVKAIYTNHDYEPYALHRDATIKEVLQKNHIPFNTYKDQVIFERDEIVKKDGNPYVVYTPYKNQWKERFKSIDLKNYDSKALSHNFIKNTELPKVSLDGIGFTKSSIDVPEYTLTSILIQNYEGTRNYPAKVNGTSRLGPHLRFGTISIRAILKKAITEENEVFWSELIWREFFMQILWHYPYTKDSSFKPKYDRIQWRNNEEEFERWKNGLTGYPIVDAGMRELNATGYMHNRVRMLVASFLCKHLLIDWRWGETYFAEKLLDYELAANIGNWQWAAGSGVDAAPYFRIFNPTTQTIKFDKNLEYITQWVPEINELTYPKPMVDHSMARERCLKTYKEVLSS